MWTVDALKDDYRVSLAAGGHINLPELNAFYGTAIKPGECEVDELHLPWPLATVEWGAALRGAYVQRSLRHLLDRFDVFLSAYNIVDFKQPAIHHLADFSWDETVRRNYDSLPGGLRRLLHVNLPLRKGYLAFARIISGRRIYTDCSNVGTILANSSWSKRLLHERYNIDTEVVYPPVLMRVTGLPPECKSRRFICLGRVYPEKRIERIIEIIKAVRRLGHDISLHIIGNTRETAYGRKIERRFQTEQDWIVFKGLQFGEAKARLLAESAYGIHARPGEAFGIAIAEMILAGCVPFVPAEGGPAEIVDHNAALVYETFDDAVSKIDRMLKNPALEATTRATLAERARTFSIDSFKRDIRRVVAEFLAARRRLHLEEHDLAVP